MLSELNQEITLNHKLRIGLCYFESHLIMQILSLFLFNETAVITSIKIGLFIQ
ncbi:hypothetical protein [Peribacillus acanthi]|uniref:hypothetical protein n=1 Tax=Peribacillus acanthi TaxID=2171554 RepID=UPI001300A6B2|nr:hypothetical protein [Peribacillus acanthi]